MTALVVGLTFVAWVREIASEIPDAPNIIAWQSSLPQSSVVMTRDGMRLQILPFVVSKETGFRTLSDGLPKSSILVKAILAAEDIRFFEHGGADGKAIVRAAIANRRAGEVVEGASTITQQVARGVLAQSIGKERTFKRKLREIFVAKKLESSYSKEQILTAYLNLPFLGDLSYGFDAAAKRYFGKESEELSIAEAALLAGLIRSPSVLNPRKYPEPAKKRRNHVIEGMIENQLVSAEEGERAIAEPLALVEGRGQPQLPWVTSQALREVKSLDKERLDRGGLTIVVTASPVVQHETSLLISKRFSQAKEIEVAYSLIENATGYRIASVGGIAFKSSQFDRSELACRQPGSAIKPILYAAGVETGQLTAATPLMDAPISEWDEEHEIYWKPNNPQSRFRGIVIAHDALVSSLNAPAVDVLNRVGFRSFRAIAAKFGIESKIATVRPSALGASCLTPVNLVKAFSAFPRLGLVAAGNVLQSIHDGDGLLHSEMHFADPFAIPQRRLEEFLQHDDGLRAISEETASIMVAMMVDVVRRGTGKFARMKQTIGGKTGTTNGNTDAWFVGFSSHHTAGVWLGRDNPKDGLGAGRDGGRYAAPLWRKLVSLADAAYPRRAIARSGNLVSASINPDNGYRLKGGGRLLQFLPGTVPELQEGGALSAPAKALGESGRNF